MFTCQTECNKPLPTPPSHCMASAHPVPAHSLDTNTLQVAVTTRWGLRREVDITPLKNPVDLSVAWTLFPCREGRANSSP